ncbi:MAG TPA: dTDP-4-dehydrorhamnose 3,5-epimerase [Bacteroidia bacterium]|jgi:dTDP-4-dehydrorhamnose 3,5-epimerase|nr:dTDP-4-dehydrorhamnose 3,5-epimerase [Bacteroidia bacterium]
MELIDTGIEGLWVIKPKVFADARGYFFESYNKDLFTKNGLNLNFVQDNQSLSHKGVLRGLHFQNPPYAQGKLVRVITGAVLDVAVDIRKNSPAYGKYFSAELTEENKTMMYIPEGFAHGFLTLRDNTIFSYKCTNLYNKASEDSIKWNDPTISVKWNVQDPLLSEKDISGKDFKAFNSLF